MSGAANDRFEPSLTDAALCTNGSNRCLEVLLDQAIRRRPFTMILHLSAEAPATAMRSR